MAAMQRLGVALLMAVCVGLVPFALAGNPLVALTAALMLIAVLLLVRQLASIRHDPED